MDTLRLIKESWFYAVRGNHEDMLLSAIDRFDSVYHTGTDFHYNGGDWFREVTDADHDELHFELAPLLEGLPYVRMIKGANGENAFNVVHAELMWPTSKYEDVAEGMEQEFLSDGQLLTLARGDNVQGLDVDRFMATSAWGRRTVRQWRETTAEAGKRRKDVANFPADICGRKGEKILVSPTPYAPELSVTFAGHSIIKRMGLHASHFFMDRGAYKSIEGFGSSDSTLIVMEAAKALDWLDINVPREILCDIPGPFGRRYKETRS